MAMRIAEKNIKQPKRARLMKYITTRSPSPESEYRQQKKLVLEKLLTTYPSEMIEEMKNEGVLTIAESEDQQLDTSSDKNGGTHPVYVVTHALVAEREDDEFNLVGTYSDVTAANFSVMSAFERKCGYLSDFGIASRGQYFPEEGKGCSWWIDDHGLLSLMAWARYLRFIVCAKKQEVRTDGLKDDLILLASSSS
ncbi:hypothetical protein F4818DRAFT_442062 [Hypoxylon cercidicola]|nr:hypothetical protein F4818DRAFT_442062 [Hypoxylon cercidicola]